MKLAAVLVLALVAAVTASPTQISDNNMGDIVNVNIEANVDISNKLEQNIISVIVASLSQQLLAIGRLPNAPNAPNFPSLPPDWRDRLPEDWRDRIPEDLVDRIRDIVEEIRNRPQQ